MDFEHWKVNWFKKRDNEPYIEIYFLSYIYIYIIDFEFSPYTKRKIKLFFIYTNVYKEIFVGSWNYIFVNELLHVTNKV